jgi:hypothetical membrane protein
MLNPTLSMPALNRRAGLVGGLAAVVAPALMWTAFIGASMATPGYNLLTRAASDLGARGAPTAAEYVPAFFYLPGALAVLVGLGLLATWKGGTAWRAGVALVVIEGAFLILAGVFAEDPHSPAATTVHQALAGVCFISAAIAPLALTIGHGGTAGSRPPLRLWLLAGGALVAIYTGAVLLGVAGVHYPQGFLQRPFTIVLTAWYVATGVWMLRAAADTSAPASDETVHSLEWQPEARSR